MIREMTSEDIKYIYELEKECFSRPWSEDSLKKEVDNPASLFLVCENNQEIIG